jgi:cell division protein FtsX
MTSPVEDRLRAALAEAGATVDMTTLQPLHADQGRRRVRVDLRLVAVVGVAVVLAGAATVIALNASGGDQQRAMVADQPAGQEDPEISLFMCGASTRKNPQCPGGAATVDQLTAMRKMLGALPEVTEVRYEDQAHVYADFRRDYAGKKALLDVIKADDMLATFRVKLKPGAKSDPVIQKAEAVRGLFSVMYPQLAATLSQPVGGDVADITVFLCNGHDLRKSCGAVVKAPKSSGGPSTVIEDGDPITSAQQEDVAKAIEGMPGVLSSHFETQQEAYDNFMRDFRTSEKIREVTRPSDMPTSFRLRMDPKADWNPVIDKSRRMAGVAQVVNNRCLTEQYKIRMKYGITPPQVELCGRGMP